MKNKELIKKEGITLIALVITILILLILAGMTITAITGKNGLLSSSLKAKEETEIEGEKEIIGMATARSNGSRFERKYKRRSLES